MNMTNRIKTKKTSCGAEYPIKAYICICHRERPVPLDFKQRHTVEYERLMAEKEHECRKRKVKEKSRHEKEHADHEREMAILSAN